MNENTLRSRIQEDMKSAMRAHDASRLGTIRLLLSAIKQREVDERITLDDSQILAVIDKMIKQRNDSVEQYQKGNRQDLADKESSEINILKEYLPKPLTEAEIDGLIDQGIEVVKASTVKDMGMVMAYIKTQAQGRADIAKISAKVKAILST